MRWLPYIKLHADIPYLSLSLSLSSANQAHKPLSLRHSSFQPYDWLVLDLTLTSRLFSLGVKQKCKQMLIRKHNNMFTLAMTL